MNDTTCLRCGAKLTMGADFSGQAFPSPHVCRPVTRAEFDALRDDIRILAECLVSIRFSAGTVEMRSSEDPWLRLSQITARKP